MLIGASQFFYFVVRCPQGHTSCLLVTNSEQDARTTYYMFLKNCNAPCYLDSYSYFLSYKTKLLFHRFIIISTQYLQAKDFKIGLFQKWRTTTQILKFRLTIFTYLI